MPPTPPITELANALIGTSAFTAPDQILAGLDHQSALAHPAANPTFTAHSIYQEVWHLAYWQQLSIDWMESRPTPQPAHASEGFPSNTAEPWPTLRDRFLQGTHHAATLAANRSNLEKIVDCPGHDNPARTVSIHDQLVSLAAHNAYHLGRIVLLRQLLNQWPPKSGGYTW